MGIQLPGPLMEAAAVVGYPFPAVDESALAARAGDWQRLAADAEGALHQLEAATHRVTGENEGDASTAFGEFMASGGGNVSSLRDFARACQLAAVTHQAAAAAVVALKTMVIAQLGIVQTALQTAKVVPQAVPVAMQLRQAAFQAIEQADRATARMLEAG